MGLVSTAPTNGHTHTNGSTQTIKSYAPATGELIGEVPVRSKEEVFAVVARARKAQQAWGVLPIEERCDRLLRLRDAIVDRADEIVALLSKETGKPRNEALVHEVLTAADLLTYYCKNAPRILAPREIDLHLLKHRKSYVHYAPRGVVGVISPWNFPFVIPMGDTFAALCADAPAPSEPRR